MNTLTLAGPNLTARVTGRAAYPNGRFHDPEAASVNAAIVASTGGKLPCYASARGGRGSFRWVSVGSSSVIARGLATRWLARYSVDLEHIEALATRSSAVSPVEEAGR